MQIMFYLESPTFWTNGETQNPVYKSNSSAMIKSTQPASKLEFSKKK